MQVNNNGISTNTNTSNKQSTLEPTSKGATQDSTAAPSTDSVELSREAQALKRLESQIIASPDVDLARIESIRQAIADGSYSVDAEATALKMLQSDDNF